jgi:peptidoglycan-associated lipoprotein
MRVVQMVLVVAAAIALAGCPKKIETKPDAGASSPTPATSGTSTSGLPATTNQAASDMAAEQAALQDLQKLGMVIYFDYDKAEIKSEFVSVVAAHAKFLNGNASRKVRLEGHTDERGSREYNIGLGERRAQKVRQALLLQGVSEAQITTISYGEERPAMSGSDEEAYAKNRRVEISYSH